MGIQNCHRYGSLNGRGPTRRTRRALARIACALLLVAAMGLATGIRARPASAAVPNPTVTGPVSAACSPMCPSPPGPVNGIHIPDAFDGVSNLQEFIDADYTEEEFYFEGTATAFERDPTAPAWDSTGSWTARPSTTMPPAAYKSRMLVRRPTDPTKFNGIVVVEWFNVTALIDLPPDYGYFRTELLRDGFIWVGVSAQYIGINGSPTLPGFALKSWDPVRYGSLVHPGDNYSWDIFSQAAQAVRNPVGVNPLGSSAYVITGMIADGESQSAGRMTTYVDAIQPLAGVFDGFLIHSRGAGGTALFASQCVGGSEPALTCISNASCPGLCSGGSNNGGICTSIGGQCTGGGTCTGTGTCPPVSGGAVPSPSFIRTDAPPVLVFETETDTVGHFAARQPDGSNYRLWEPAGTAHVDDYDYTAFNVNSATTEPFYPAQSCVFPRNMANEHYVMNAAILHLSQWINGGTPPPSAPPITVSGTPLAIQRDQYNNALGGIRLPEMDVPTQTLQGVGNTSSPPSSLSFCVLFGRTVPLGSQCVGGTETPGTVCISDSQCLHGGTCQAVPLSSVYRNHGKYVSEFAHATDDLENAGFLLDPDAEEAKTHAAESDVP
jgi:alpha/beta hydrolase family protein